MTMGKYAFMPYPRNWTPDPYIADIYRDFASMSMSNDRVVIMKGHSVGITTYLTEQNDAAVKVLQELSAAISPTKDNDAYMRQLAATGRRGMKAGQELKRKIQTIKIMENKVSKTKPSWQRR